MSLRPSFEIQYKYYGESCCSSVCMNASDEAPDLISHAYMCVNRYQFDFLPGGFKKKSNSLFFTKLATRVGKLCEYLRWESSLRLESGNARELPIPIMRIPTSIAARFFLSAFKHELFACFRTAYPTQGRWEPGTHL